ncbi:MAG: UDP-2,4-diacetamido-2,4,6-trideoxy-beta-L-altropyranose hydrolase [Bacteroidales bacterium]|nr:UDP-2,4-diacetamido-2,4,6-trideoxy-beta-L-altropyranose hydrolase [Bacteroidales bacterium]
MTGRRAIFRADASPKIGGGHVMRCLALADGLAEAGWDCCFAVTGQTLETVPAITSAHRHVFLKGPARREVAELEALVGRVELLVLDHYERDVDYEKACRQVADVLLVLEDLPHRWHEADALLDQTLGRDASEYRARVPDGCRLMLGPSYALLRSMFANGRDASLSRRDGTLSRILVTMGYSDPRDLTTLALQAIGAAQCDVEVDVVLGGVSPNISRVRKAIGTLDICVRLHLDTTEMARLMQEADLAIGASGVTSWERCVLGVPTLAVITAENQRTIATRLRPRGLFAWREIGRRIYRSGSSR